MGCQPPRRPVDRRTAVAGRVRQVSQVTGLLRNGSFIVRKPYATRPSGTFGSFKVAQRKVVEGKGVTHLYYEVVR